MTVNLPIQYQKQLIGQTLSFTNASADGHTFANSAGNVNLWVAVNKVTSIELTVEVRIGGQSNKVITINGSSMTILPSFSQQIYTGRLDGLARFTIDEISNVTLAAVCVEQYGSE